MRKTILSWIIWGTAGWVLYTKGIKWDTWQLYALLFLLIAEVVNSGE